MTDQARISAATQKLAVAAENKRPVLFAGPDGFVDEIIRVVDKRYDAHRFDAIGTIGEYARRLAQAAGKSTNIEFHVERVKAGGNGPLLCEAFGRLGGRANYVGCVGWPDVDPLFEYLKEYGDVLTLSPPAVTLATEFEDGKIMNGKHQALRNVTWENFLKAVGGVDGLRGRLNEADVFSLINWTMIPFLNEVLEGVLGVVETMGENAPRMCFFDLCDPEKRTREDLLEALALMGQYAKSVETAILGLNEKESLELCKAYGIDAGGDDGPGLADRARRLAEKTGLTEIVIHPTRCAAAWSARESGFAQGPFCRAPKLTTGAGDHFNGGYVYARILGLAPSDALVIGKCVSGFYVREGRGPSAGEIVLFGDRWVKGRLDPWESVG